MRTSEPAAESEETEKTERVDSAQAKEELARSAYAAFNKKDIPTVMGMFADGILWEVPGKSVQSGVFNGKSEVGRYFSIVGKFTAGTHTVEPLELLATDDGVVALLRARGQHEAKTFDMTVIHLIEISDGKVTKLSIIPTDQYAFDAFWS